MRCVAAYAAVRPERAGIAVISGEAGIGKTRLGEAVADHVRAQGGTVLRRAPTTGERGIAYGPIVELLRAALADPGAVERLDRAGRPVGARRGCCRPSTAAAARASPRRWPWRPRSARGGDRRRPDRPGRRPTSRAASGSTTCSGPTARPSRRSTTWRVGWPGVRCWSCWPGARRISTRRRVRRPASRGAARGRRRARAARPRGRGRAGGAD